MAADWYTAAALAKRWGVGASTVRRWCASGSLRSFRTAGGHNRVSTSEVERFEARLAQRRGTPLPALGT